MKTLAIMLLLWTSLAGHSENRFDDDMERIRNNYAKAPNDKKLCKAMIEELSKAEQSPVHLAYLGGFKAIWAKHTLNPIAKLATFNKGKKYIEQAVRLAPENIDIRFVRLSIQKNCPFFLGYDGHIEKDSQFINANKHSITSSRLKEMLADMI